MEIKTLNDFLYKILSDYKDTASHNKSRQHFQAFPRELLDVCVIMLWRHKQFKKQLKRLGLTQEDGYVFINDHSLLSLDGNVILPPIRIEMDRVGVQNSMAGFLYRMQYQERELINPLQSYIYTLCANPLLIKNNQKLIDLIVKIAKKVKKQRSKSRKLVVLRVIHQQTDKVIFPMENYFPMYFRENLLPKNIYN